MSDPEHHYEQALHHLEQIDDREVSAEWNRQVERIFDALDNLYPVELAEDGDAE